MHDSPQSKLRGVAPPADHVPGVEAVVVFRIFEMSVLERTQRSQAAHPVESESMSYGARQIDE